MKSPLRKRLPRELKGEIGGSDPYDCNDWVCIRLSGC